MVLVLYQLFRFGSCFPPPQQEPPLIFSTRLRSTADEILIVRTAWDLGLAIHPRAHPRVVGTRYGGVGFRQVSGVVELGA